MEFLLLTNQTHNQESVYCDCICGCYELASLRDEDTGKGYCPACGKDHLELNTGIGLPNPAPVKVSVQCAGKPQLRRMPAAADPPAAFADSVQAKKVPGRSKAPPRREYCLSTTLEV